MKDAILQAFEHIEDLCGNLRLSQTTNLRLLHDAKNLCPSFLLRGFNQNFNPCRSPLILISL